MIAFVDDRFVLGGIVGANCVRGGNDSALDKEFSPLPPLESFLPLTKSPVKKVRGTWSKLDLDLGRVPAESSGQG